MTLRLRVYGARNRLTYPFSLAVRDEFRTLRLIHRISLSALDDEFRWRRWTKGNREAWDHADQVILESTNEQLNRIIDAGIANVFRLLRNGLTIQETRLHRNTMLKALEDRYLIRCAALPGW